MWHDTVIPTPHRNINTMYRIVYLITWWRLTLLTCSRIDSINSGLIELISAYGCMDFSSYFQAGSESRSVSCPA